MGTGRSEIRNRILAPIFKDLKLIEAWGTGIQKMRLETEKYPEIELSINEVGNAFQIQFMNTAYKEAQSPTQSNNPVIRLLMALSDGELSSGVLREKMGLKHRQTFRENYLHPALNRVYIELTIPEKPNSRLQKYRLTEKGKRNIEE